MPVKVGGKGKMQEYDPATGKFGRGTGEPAKERDNDAVVTIVWHGQKVVVKGALSKYRPKPDKIEDNSVDFEKAVENNRK
jgi:hypothetical protein